MNRALCLFLLSIFMLSSSAQAQIWTQTFGGSSTDEGFSVQLTSDGGYIIAGKTYSFGAGGYDVFLIKANAEGNQQWSRTYGGSGEDFGYSVQQTSDGGYIIAGNTYSYGAGNTDVWLIKTDAAGNQQWSQTYGGSSPDIGYCVQQTSDGGYIITGETWSFGVVSSDLYLVKTDASGNQQWSQTFGGAGQASGQSVQQTSDSGYISVGIRDDSIYLVKTDAAGNQQWIQMFGGYNSYGGYSVQQTSDSGYIIAGFTFGDVYLLKTDASGNQQWNHTYGGTGADCGRSVRQTSDGGYIIAGYYTASYYNADVYLLKTDASGAEQWNQTFGGGSNDKGYSVQVTSNNEYIIAGFTSSYGAGLADFWLIRAGDPAVSVASEVPAVTRLTGAAPNPFNPTTTITFNLARSGPVRLDMFDMRGRLLRVLVDERLPAGRHEVPWDGRDDAGWGMASGVYLSQLRADGVVEMGKMVLVR